MTFNADNEHPKYPRTFKPIRLGPVEITNRIYMGPHGLPLDTPIPGLGSHGEPSAEHAFYFAERAAGGAGLIFHSTLLGPFADIANYIHATPALAETIPSYAKVAELVHAEGAKMMAEIWYLPWVQHRWEVLGPAAPSLAPSSMPFWDPSIPAAMYEMRKHDIAGVIEAHRLSALHLREAGYDGVELHLAHGSILEYFLSGYFNRRTDEYGGSFDNRIRLVLETLEVTRVAAGPDMAVGVRMNADQMLAGGFDEEGARSIVERLAASGCVDFVDLDISVEPEQRHLTTSSYLEQPQHNLGRIGRVGSAVSPLPVLATPGRVTSIAVAEKILADGICDMVGITRGMIAEPELVNNARDGHEGASRICIGANHCIHNNAASQGWGCAINAAAGREERWGTKKLGESAPHAMRVVVVGGGPAGLEAARVAGQRGHEVTVLEREASVGGALNLWGVIPGRESVLTYGPWALARFNELGVTVRTGVDADVETILGYAPDVVFVATGSRYVRTGVTGSVPTPVEGWDRANVLTPEAVLNGSVKLTGRVLVVDDEGFQAGVGVAEIAGAGGADVEFITRFSVPAQNVGLDLPYILPRLKAAGVKISPLTVLKQIDDGRVVLEHTLSQEERVVDGVDSIVLVTVRMPEDGLAAQLEGKVSYVYLIGDALSARSLREATYEGHRFGRGVGELKMPRHTTDEMFFPLNSLRRAALA